jgi:hypothetical protein
MHETWTLIHWFARIAADDLIVAMPRSTDGLVGESGMRMGVSGSVEG